jgi:hypothetical protein
MKKVLAISLLMSWLCIIIFGHPSDHQESKTPHPLEAVPIHPLSCHSRGNTKTPEPNQTLLRSLLTREPQNTNLRPRQIIPKRIPHQLHNIRIISLPNMPHRVQRAELLHIKIPNPLLANKRRLGRHHQLIVLRSQNRIRNPFLSNRAAVIKPFDSIALREQVRASSAANSLNDLIDERARELRRDVGDVIQAQEGSAVGRGRNSKNPLNNLLDTFAEFRHVQDLEGAFGVAYKIDFGGAGFGLDGFDERGDFVRGCCDGFEAADEGEEGVFAVGGAGC